jgi:hypothetical protein
MDLGLNDIKATLADYFDGIYESSEDKLRSAFHPDAHIYSATDGTLADFPLDTFVDRVTSRKSCSSQGAPRTDKIVSIDFSGPNSAGQGRTQHSRHRFRRLPVVDEDRRPLAHHRQDLPRRPASRHARLNVGSLGKSGRADQPLETSALSHKETWQVLT